MLSLEYSQFDNGLVKDVVVDGSYGCKLRDEQPIGVILASSS